MGHVFVTIPTAGRDTLAQSVDSTGIDRDHIIIVTTAPDVPVPAGCRSVQDLGPINIHRWWNRGIDLAESYGATHVAVLNDDVRLDADTLPTLVDAMDGATLASPGDPLRTTCTDKYVPMTIVGSCWVLDVRHGLRPDTKYRWWFGDNDLDWRARRDHHGIVRTPAFFEHLAPNLLTSRSPELQQLANLDALTWAQA